MAAKPFLKWAGGKTQLLGRITEYLPAAMGEGKIETYVEPFIGGGATFFHLIQKYAIARSYISDRNEELTLAYTTLQQHGEEVIERLQAIAQEYGGKNPQEQKSYFYALRACFNAARPAVDFAAIDAASAERTAQLIFLNRTCYNGLFRVNASGEFNVPFGAYRNPRICDAENLRAVSTVLQKTQILRGDFALCAPLVDEKSFVYFDPPYRPISRTASFNAYASQLFDDAAQTRLAQLYRELDARGAKLMLSNSDPKNEEPTDDFFETLFAGFAIHRVAAKRAINSNGAKRGEINELLITNY